MFKLRPRYISFDFACTLFWEPGCDPRIGIRYVRDALYSVIEYVEKKGYRVNKPDDPWEEYLRIWRKIRERGPVREIWHRYILLKYLYSLGARIDSYLLDEIYKYFIGLRVKHYTLVPKIDYLLEYLRGKSYELVLTTGTASHDLIIEVIKHSGLDKYFRLIHSTQLTGIPKSDPRFYSELIDLLNIEPDEIIHIGDSLKYDIYPARSSGIKTIYYGWRTWCRAVDPQPCITSLWELYHLL